MGAATQTESEGRMFAHAQEEGWYTLLVIKRLYRVQRRGCKKWTVNVIDDDKVSVRSIGNFQEHPRPKEFRVQKSAGKVLASIFWDQDGILVTDYLPKGHTVNAEYYSSLLVQLKAILKEKHRMVTKVVLFLRDNAPAHRALATQKKLAYLGFQCLDHSPYSPDLAPSDCDLFSGLKKSN